MPLIVEPAQSNPVQVDVPVVNFALAKACLEEYKSPMLQSL